MRIHVGILVLALLIGAVLYVAAVLFNSSLKAAHLLFAVIFGIALISDLFIAMAQQAVYVRELVKQIAVWLGVVVLLPLSVWFGTSAFSPPPDRKKYDRSEERLDVRISEAQGQAEREKLRGEREQLRQERDEAEREFYGTMFWVAYPIGLVAILVGIFYPIQAVGAGLMFGGLASLAAGCYSYWDKMDAWLRFGSLVLALAVLLVLGTLRLRGASGSAPNKP
jgi:hypothetical protein